MKDREEGVTMVREERGHGVEERGSGEGSHTLGWPESSQTSPAQGGCLRAVGQSPGHGLLDPILLQHRLAVGVTGQDFSHP